MFIETRGTLIRDIQDIMQIMNSNRFEKSYKSSSYSMIVMATEAELIEKRGRKKKTAGPEKKKQIGNRMHKHILRRFKKEDILDLTLDELQKSVVILYQFVMSHNL